MFATAHPRPSLLGQHVSSVVIDRKSRQTRTSGCLARTPFAAARDADSDCRPVSCRPVSCLPSGSSPSPSPSSPSQPEQEKRQHHRSRRETLARTAAAAAVFASSVSPLPSRAAAPPLPSNGVTRVVLRTASITPDAAADYLVEALGLIKVEEGDDPGLNPSFESAIPDTLDSTP